MAKALSRTDNEIAALYRRHVDTVYRVCYTYLKNPADTEDAVADTFIRLMKSGPAFESEEHEKAWLIRTAANVCKDFLKHWWRRAEDLTAHAETLPAQNGFETDGLLEAVCALPEKYKAVIHLYYYEGYTSVQIAAMLRKPQSTIRGCLSQARAILRKTSGGDFDEK